MKDKINQIFPDKVVRKDLVRKVKVGANVPVYVLEYLLGNYCATDDELWFCRRLYNKGSHYRCQSL